MNILLLSLGLFPLQEAATAPPRSLLSVEVPSAGLHENDLWRLDFDLVYREVEAGTVQVLADAADRERLASLGVAYTVLHDDLAAFYAERARQDGGGDSTTLGAWLTPAFGSGSLGSYYTWTEVVSVLDQIHAAYPALTTPKFSIGQTVEGRDIWAMKISDNPEIDEAEPEVRFDSMHHSREPQSMQTTIWAMLCLLENYGTDARATYLVDEREMWFLPVVNPDGYVYNETTNPGGGGLWRKNRRDTGGPIGVDLNRNYSFQWGFDNIGSSPNQSSEVYRGPSAASEPEVQAMEAFIDSRDFQTALSTHTFGNYWLTPWGYTTADPPDVAEITEISALVTMINNYLFGPGSVILSPANGVTDDYDYGVHGTFAWTPEIGSSGDGFWPAPSRIVPLAQENEESFLGSAHAAGAYVLLEDLAFADQGDGDGSFEAGETFEVTTNLRNSGRGGATVDVALSSGDPEIVIGTGAASVGSVGAFSSASNATPLSFSIQAGTPSGTSLSVTVSVTYEGYTQDFDESFIVGEERLFVVDDLEVDVGWTAGLPGDTAATGLWEWGDPVGTTSSGQPSNPEDDASPSGVNCFTTGNGSTTAGGDDVDDGLTTLISPAIDLSGVSLAVLRYQRWFTNLTVLDDTLQIALSDDDGSSWVTLEDVTGNQNQWSDVSFVVNDFVSLTESVRLRVIAEDDPNNSLTEAAFDELSVLVYDDTPRMNVYGRAQVGTPLALHVTGDSGEQWVVYASQGTATISLAGVVGDILLDPVGLNKLGAGAVPASGFVRNVATLPNDPGLIGETFFLQAATVGGQIKMSNRVEMTFE